jgi:hypothetical protein
MHKHCCAQNGSLIFNRLLFVTQQFLVIIWILAVVLLGMGARSRKGQWNPSLTPFCRETCAVLCPFAWKRICIPVQLRAQWTCAKSFHVLFFGAARCTSLPDGALSVLELTPWRSGVRVPHEPTIYQCSECSSMTHRKSLSCPPRLSSRSGSRHNQRNG